MGAPPVFVLCIAHYLGADNCLSLLCDRAQEKLDAINFEWKPRRGVYTPWEEQYEALVEYKNTHGADQDPPRKYSVQGAGNRQLNLGKWCDTQRQTKKQGKLTADRIERLEKINFKWAPYVTVDWSVYLDALTKYKEAHVSCQRTWWYASSQFCTILTVLVVRRTKTHHHNINMKSMTEARSS